MVRAFIFGLLLLEISYFAVTERYQSKMVATENACRNYSCLNYKKLIYLSVYVTEYRSKKSRMVNKSSVLSKPG